MPERATVSVIIPAFNAGDYLAKALDSVLEHGAHTDLDIIVVDDGSTDHTAAVAAVYSRQIRYFLIPHSGRPAVARNYGIRVADGELIAFLDADDYWLPGALAERLDILRARRELGFVYGNYYLLDKGRRTACFSTRKPPSGQIFNALFRECFVDTSTVLVRRSLLQAAGGFSEFVHTAEDYWLWLQLAFRSEAFFIAEPIAVKHVHSDSISHRPLVRKLHDLIFVITSIARECAVDHSEACARLIPVRLWLANVLFEEHKYAAGLHQLGLALLHDPSLTVSGALTRLRRSLNAGAGR